ncbi:MAG TPA: hypothetical protein DCR20_12690 [Planctomycetaceae bacterium]|nr:hypothetical protein [Planctomycetaceae bacterium]
MDARRPHRGRVPRARGAAPPPARRPGRGAARQRRAAARAREQEMVARIQQNRAAVVLAESEVPRAVAEAFGNGNLGLLDFYELKNVQADTRMRESIAGDGTTRAGGTTEA